MSEPQTDAGRALLLRLTTRGSGDNAPFEVAVARIEAEAAAAERARLDDLGAAWAEVEAALPEGWLFHGVTLTDNSMDGGDWGPDWAATASWPDHCTYDDCDHDEAFRSARAATPLAALTALAALLREERE